MKSKYSFFQKIKMMIWLIKTKIFYRKSRLIRFPFDIRGRKYIYLGIGLTTGIGCRLEAFSDDGQKTMRFGKNIQMNDYVHICSMQNVYIGNNVLMASHIYISDNSHGNYKGSEYDTDPEISPIDRPYYISSVNIADNVWIGEGAVVLPGVSIGEGSIVGANSVVTKNVAPYTIVAGSPAKPIKKYSFSREIWEKI
jgi:lipopolysaccharide O-acetyltransferase